MNDPVRKIKYGYSVTTETLARATDPVALVTGIINRLIDHVPNYDWLKVRLDEETDQVFFTVRGLPA